MKDDEEDKPWHSHLPIIAATYNTTSGVDMMGYTPYELMFGLVPKTVIMGDSINHMSHLGIYTRLLVKAPEQVKVANKTLCSFWEELV